MKYFIRFFCGTHNIMKKVGQEERFIADFESVDKAIKALERIKRNQKILESK